MLSSIINDTNQSSMLALHLQNLALAAGWHAVGHICHVCAIVRHQKHVLSPRLLELQSWDFLAAHNWTSSGSCMRAPSQSLLCFSTMFATVQAGDNGDFELLPALFCCKEQAPASTAGCAPPVVCPRAHSVVVKPHAPSPKHLVTSVKCASETAIMSPRPQHQCLAHITPISQDGNVSMTNATSISTPAADNTSAGPTINFGKSTITANIPAAHLFDDEIPVVLSKNDSVMDLTKEDTVLSPCKISMIDTHVYNLINSATIISPAPKFQTINVNTHILSDEDADNIKSLLNDDDLSSVCSL